MNHCKFFSISPVLLLLLTGSLQAQTTKATTGSLQLQKGHWMISHNLVSIAPYNNEYTYYDQNNKIIRRYTESGTYFSLLFSGPSWGNISGGGGKTKNFDAANKQTSNGKSSSFSFYLNPNAGYFIQDRLMLGGQILFNYYSGNGDEFEIPNYTYTRKSKQTSIGLGPEIRYYFGNAAAKQLFHGGVSSLFSTGKGTDDYKTVNNSNQKNGTTTDTKTSSYTITPYVGSSWKLGKNWLFESALFSNISNYKTENETLQINNNINSSSSSTTKAKPRNIVGVRAGICYTF